MNILDRIYDQKTTEGAFREAKSIASERLKEIRKLEPLAHGTEALEFERLRDTITWLTHDWYFTLADIGTSETELDYIGQKMYLSSSKRKLAWLLQQPKLLDDSARIEARSIRQFANKGGFTLADIGTSEKELTELSVKL